MRVLVTGAKGMVARAVFPALRGAGHEVLGLTRSDADVTRPDALTEPTRAFRPDWIFHLAGFTRVDECEARPDHAFRVNAGGAENSARAAAACGASILALSTDYVFDGTARTPYPVDAAAAPQSVYGASQWAGERAVREAHARHVVVRTAWLFGEGGANFVDTILEKARAGEALRVVDDQRGSPTWTADLAPALVALAAGGHHGTYHVTSSGDCTWFDLARHALEREGLEVPLEPITAAALARPARRPAYSVLDNALFERVTGRHMPHWREAVDRHLETRRTAPVGASRPGWEAA